MDKNCSKIITRRQKLRHSSVAAISTATYSLTEILKKSFVIVFLTMFNAKQIGSCTLLLHLYII